jgi:ATP dependent DNA ligase domain
VSAIAKANGCARLDLCDGGPCDIRSHQLGEVGRVIGERFGTSGQGKRALGKHWGTCQAQVRRKARLWSRNHLPLEPKFPTIREAVNQLKLRSTIMDGEIGALDENGIPRFQLLQHWQKRPTAPVVYFLFAVLWSDGRDLTGKTVLQRRERLEKIITPVDGNPSGPLGRESRQGSLRIAKKERIRRYHRQAQSRRLPAGETLFQFG